MPVKAGESRWAGRGGGRVCAAPRGRRRYRKGAGRRRPRPLPQQRGRRDGWERKRSSHGNRDGSPNNLGACEEVGLKGALGPGCVREAEPRAHPKQGARHAKAESTAKDPRQPLQGKDTGRTFFFFLRKRGASQRSESGMSRLQSEQVQRPCCRVDRGGMEETGVLPKDRGLGRLGSWAVPGNWSKSWGAGSQTERLRVKAGSQTCHSSAGSCAPPVLRWGSQR